MTPKQRLYAAMRGKPVDRTPVTPIVMAWAAHHTGRSYRDYYLQAPVLAESQIAVARDFHTEQVSAISDPWREAEGYGMVLDYPEEGVGVPRALVIQSRADVQRLGVIDIDRCPRMLDRVDAVHRMAQAVGGTHSVMGWVEGPIAEYVDLRGMQDAMVDFIDDPGMYHEAAEVLVRNAIAFAGRQVEAGADMIGVGDAAASLIGPELFEQLALPWQKRLFDAIHAMGATVKLHICGNIASVLTLMARTGADILDVDWMVDLGEARKRVGEQVALAGNFDPAAVLLRGSAASVAAAAQRCIQQAGPRFILQPGCEVPPGTPVENMRAFCPAT